LSNARAQAAARPPPCDGLVDIDLSELLELGAGTTSVEHRSRLAGDLAADEVSEHDDDRPSL
jgi:hypothetical protein